MKGKHSAIAQRKAENREAQLIESLQIQLRETKAELAKERQVLCRDERHDEPMLRATKAEHALQEATAENESLHKRVLHIEELMDGLIDSLLQTEQMTIEAWTILAEIDKVKVGTRVMRRSDRRKLHRVQDFKTYAKGGGLNV